MSNFFLIVTASILCLLIGAMASVFSINFDLDIAKQVFMSVLSLTCLPLSLYMAYIAKNEHELNQKG